MGVHDAAAEAQAKELLGIPADEPIFILRAQDKLAFPTIMRYMGFAQDIETEVRPSDEWFENLMKVGNEFIDFKDVNPGMMKVPD